MALKKEQNNNNIEFEDLMEDLECEYDEERTYTTISGKELDDVFEWEKIPVYELGVGDTFTGKPNVSYFVNDDKKYNSLRVRALDDGEYVDAYINIPKPDELGYVTNIRKSFDFYRTAYDFIYSVLRYRDEHNVVDENGEEVTNFKKVNILTFAKYVDQMERIGIKITEGNIDSDYNSWIIYKME